MAMYRCGFVFFLLVTQILGSTEEEPQSCIDLLEAEDQDCCESLKIFDAFDDGMDDCGQSDSKELNCADYTCILRKKGIMKGDNIDESMAKDLFANIAQSHPEEKDTIESMEKLCFDGNYKHYNIVDESCPAINFYVCAFINVLLDCKSWKQTDACKKLSETANNCKSELEKMS